MLWNRSTFPVLLMSGICAAGLFSCRNQPQVQTKPGDRPTIYELAQDKSRQGDIRLSKNVDYPAILSIDALADLSDAVVIGKVTRSGAVPCEDMTFVCTEFRVKVRQVLWRTIPADRRGKDHMVTVLDKRTGRPADENTPEVDRIAGREPAPDEIVVTQPGGSLTISGRRVVGSVTDQAFLQVNDEYVLFLHWVPASRPSLWGSEMYVPYAGSRGIMQIDGSQVRDLGGPPTYVSTELERSYNNDLARLVSHFAERRKNAT